MNENEFRTANRAESWGPVPVGELLSAVLAVKRGEFRHGAAGRRSEPLPVSTWRPAPGEVPVLVIGCAGSSGASTFALALAIAATRSRVVECSPGACSGLAGASTAELGEVSDGWVEGTREGVRIQRRRDQTTSPEAVPGPLPGTTGGVTIVDCWWDLRQVLDGQGWLGDLARECPRVVLVTRATVPGLRRLEGCLALLGAERCWTVATGVSPFRWAKPVEHSMGRLTRQLLSARRLVCVPDDPRLSISGIGTEPLPRPYGHTAALLLEGLLS